MNTTIRTLKYGDFRKLSKLFEQLTVKIGDTSLLKLITADNSKQQESESNNDDSILKIGATILKSLIQYLEDDIAIWYADLCCVTPEIFENEAPFNILIDVTNQILEQEDVKSFLAGASKLSNLIKGYKNLFSKESK